MKKCVAIISGGMDSITMLHDLVADKYEVLPLTFDYGQRHVKEIEMSMYNCWLLNCDLKVVNLGSITNLISNSALTGDTEVPHGHFEDEIMRKTVVPNRNMIMMSIAVGYAINNDCDEVFYGAHVGDHAIYPDCRLEFVDALQKVVNICHYEPIKIHTPFINLKKRHIIQLGMKIGVDYSKTWTCYEGKDLACGKCGSCQERLEAFKEMNIKDPLQYEEVSSESKVN